MPRNIIVGNFDLEDTLSEVLAKSPAADPDAITDLLLRTNAIPKKAQSEVMRVGLREIVREHIRYQRRPHMRHGVANFSQRLESGYRYWRMYLPSLGYVWLDDCTPSMLLDAASVYEQRARQQMRVADELERIAGLFDNHPRAKTVADLPEGEVREVAQAIADEYMDENAA